MIIAASLISTINSLRILLHLNTPSISCKYYLHFNEYRNNVPTRIDSYNTFYSKWLKSQTNRSQNPRCHSKNDSSPSFMNSQTLSKDNLNPPSSIRNALCNRQRIIRQIEEQSEKAGWRIVSLNYSGWEPQWRHIWFQRYLNTLPRPRFHVPPLFHHRS